MARKYGNQPTVAYGIEFDSRKESRHYLYLRSRLEAGEISDLRIKPRYELIPAFTYQGKRVRAAMFTPDFDYLENGVRVVYEVKGGRATQTTAYKLREKLFCWRYPHIRLEVAA